jgi:hypothetical protein
MGRSEGGEADLILGAQQDDVRESGFDGVADTARALEDG